MTHLFIERSAADNAYLHKDFHGALSTGLDYIERMYGDEAVRSYLRRFAQRYYAPLTAAISARGLDALQEYLVRIYAIEGGQIAIERSEDTLTLRVEACPAIMHMQANGYAIARLFSETTKTVYPAICAGTPFAAEVLEYDEATGHSVVRFSRRAS